MKAQQHLDSFEACAYCQAYVRLGESFGKAADYAATTRRLHKQAVARKLRASVAADHGLVKVRGALSGVYWE